MSKIIACFSCTGKTHYCLNNYEKIDCIDHDMYDFKFRGQLNNRWLVEYVKRLNQLMSKFEFVFVNAIPGVIDYLPINSLVVYPHRELKDEWVARARLRGGESTFADLLESSWDEWIDKCEGWYGAKLKVESGQYLSDVLIDLKAKDEDTPKEWIIANYSKHFGDTIECPLCGKRRTMPAGQFPRVCTYCKQEIKTPKPPLKDH